MAPQVGGGCRRECQPDLGRLLDHGCSSKCNHDTRYKSGGYISDLRTEKDVSYGSHMLLQAGPL